MHRNYANSHESSARVCFALMNCHIDDVGPRPWLPLDNFHVHWQIAEIISRMARVSQFSPRACGVRKFQVLRNVRRTFNRTIWKKLAKSSGQVCTLVATHKQTHLVLDINSLFSIRFCIVRFAIPMQFSWQVGFAYREFQWLSYKYTIPRYTNNESCTLYNKFQRIWMKFQWRFFGLL